MGDLKLNTPLAFATGGTELFNKSVLPAIEVAGNSGIYSNEQLVTTEDTEVDTHFGKQRAKIFHIDINLNGSKTHEDITVDPETYEIYEAYIKGPSLDSKIGRFIYTEDGKCRTRTSYDFIWKDNKLTKVFKYVDIMQYCDDGINPITIQKLTYTCEKFDTPEKQRDCDSVDIGYQLREHQIWVGCRPLKPPYVSGHELTYYYDEHGNLTNTDYTDGETMYNYDQYGDLKCIWKDYKNTDYTGSDKTVNKIGDYIVPHSQIYNPDNKDDPINNDHFKVIYSRMNQPDHIINTESYEIIDKGQGKRPGMQFDTIKLIASSFKNDDKCEYIYDDPKLIKYHNIDRTSYTKYEIFGRTNHVSGYEFGAVSDNKQRDLFASAPFLYQIYKSNFGGKCFLIINYLDKVVTSMQSTVGATYEYTYDDSGRIVTSMKFIRQDKTMELATVNEAKNDSIKVIESIIPSSPEKQLDDEFIYHRVDWKDGKITSDYTAVITQ